MTILLFFCFENLWQFVTEMLLTDNDMLPLCSIFDSLDYICIKLNPID